MKESDEIKKGDHLGDLIEGVILEDLTEMGKIQEFIEC